MTNGPVPIEVELSSRVRLRGHEWSLVGPPVIFLHDVGLDLDSWERTAPTVAEKGFRVLAIDLRGHGLSDGEPDEKTLPADTIALVRAVREVRGPCALIAAGKSARGALRVGRDLGAPVQILVSPCGFEEADLRTSRAAIRLILVGAGDPQAHAEAKQAYDGLRGQRMMGSTEGSLQGAELLAKRASLLEDVILFLRRYLAPVHMRWVQEEAGPVPAQADDGDAAGFRYAREET